MHHVSIRTGNIHRSMAFYQVLGFEVTERFTTGMTLACWMEGLGGRIELIEIPQPRPAPDSFGDEHYTGYYHLSFDLTAKGVELGGWLAELIHRFSAVPDLPPLKVLLAPMQQMIGDQVYEVMFIADPDGLPLEFLRCYSPV